MSRMIPVAGRLVAWEAEETRLPKFLQVLRKAFSELPTPSQETTRREPDHPSASVLAFRTLSAESGAEPTDPATEQAGPWTVWKDVDGQAAAPAAPAVGGPAFEGLDAGEILDRFTDDEIVELERYFLHTIGRAQEKHHPVRVARLLLRLSRRELELLGAWAERQFDQASSAA